MGNILIRLCKTLTDDKTQIKIKIFKNGRKFTKEGTLY